MSDNLHTLRRREAEDSSSSDSRSPKKRFPLPSLAKSLPWLLVAAFVVLAWLLFGDRFERARSVELIKVITMRASAEIADSTATSSSTSLNFEGAALFQASGWIESDPLPIRVTTLYSGVVDQVHVLQGEKVTKGQVIASMVDDDARLDLETAKANLLQIEAALEQSKSAIESTKAALNTLDKEISSAESRLAEVEDQYQRLNKAGTNVFRESEITQAKLRVDSQVGSVEALQSRVDELNAKLRSDYAAVQATEARVVNAKVEVDRRQLAMDRTDVRSPVDGRIQELYAAPGLKRMLNMDGPETATIAKVFRPELLQARIDVPLEEAAQLVIGQPVRLRSTLLPNKTFKGQVTRIDGQADLQRNTLQAKVRLLEPDEQLRPEMLCRAEFLKGGAEESSGPSMATSGRAAIYVPEAILSGSGRERTVWALDASGKRVEQRRVVVDLEARDGHLRVIEGLRPGEFVVQNPPSDLEAGERVRTKLE